MSTHEHARNDDITRFGFWLYILSDTMIFGALFATYVILRHNTVSGPSVEEAVNPPYVLLQTLLLLTSSFTCAVAIAAVRYGKLREAKSYLWMTLALGMAFLGLELAEFWTMVQHGEGWYVNAALSGFFALVATHGLHITIGLIWLGAMLVTLYKKGVTHAWQRRLGLFGVYWHFLDIIWIGIFTIVYMFSAGGV